jgi:hypothetical protein
MDNEKDEGNNSSHHHSRYIFHSTTLEGTTNSSSTTEGLPYVGCYKGFNDGALFPLREGLLFFKPPLFVHRSKLVSISCGRGSGLGGGSSRYVDMIATLDDDDSDDDDDDVETNKSATKTKKKKKKKKKKETILEFTNINRDELPGLNDYIHKVLIPAMKSDCDNVVDDVTGDNDKNTDIDANSDEEMYILMTMKTWLWQHWSLEMIMTRVNKVRLNVPRRKALRYGSTDALVQALSRFPMVLPKLLVAMEMNANHQGGTHGQSHYLVGGEGGG